MNFNFATCERHRALGFIQRVYPSKDVTDTPESAGPLLDFVEKDIVRIQDPTMHGSNIEVIQGTHWEDADADTQAAVMAACTKLHEGEKHE